LHRQIGPRAAKRGREKSAFVWTREDQNAFRRWKEQLRIIRDRVQGVVEGFSTGFYLFGRPGTSKTHTVRRTLGELKVQYHYHSGHLTPQGVFELFENHPESVLVLDDVAAMLSQPVALQYLLAALGNSNAGHARLVRYQRQGDQRTVRFHGRIIAISNLELHSEPLLNALKSRVHCLQYEPSAEQMIAVFRHLARRGWALQGRKLTPRECSDVVEYVIAESARLSIQLDLRVLFSKAFPDYLQYREGSAETHWRDLVNTTLQERVRESEHETTTISSRRRLRLASETEIAQQIRKEFATAEDQVNQWVAQTGRSRRSYFRRLQSA
jgi:hypothetical protein